MHGQAKRACNRDSERWRKETLFKMIKPGEKRGLREGLETTTIKSECLVSSDLTLKP